MKFILEMKEYLVMKVMIVIEVMTGDVSPVAMFCHYNYSLLQIFFRCGYGWAGC